ncbi:hypothetical protein NPIL_39291 [Nephila pilipes]|uniref:Uncharacterized protein n=1 Tax=Nephila pilipes TaxID=299642 RepID=A0A8X6R0T5_NEPPI|nr:hypothetical protein NPIL_39291 [Nephila pilipes]
MVGNDKGRCEERLVDQGESAERILGHWRMISLTVKVMIHANAQARNAGWMRELSVTGSQRIGRGVRSAAITHDFHPKSNERTKRMDLDVFCFSRTERTWLCLTAHTYPWNGYCDWIVLAPTMD